jgi:hypothetical protein
MQPDALMLMGLFLLMIEGLLTYEFIMRNPTLHVAAAVPSPVGPVRRSYRRQGMAFAGILTTACMLGSLGLRFDDPTTAYPAVHVALPLLIGLPIYGAALCWLCRALAEPEEAARLGKKLSGGFLSADMAILIYGLAMAYGVLGGWLLVAHFAHRIWIESGNPRALIIVTSGGTAVSLAALMWMDRRGLQHLVRAAARIRYLDRQVLSMATPTQETHPALLKKSTKPGMWLLVRIQMLRRSPLWLVGVAGIIAVTSLRADGLGWNILLTGVALGVLLDLPNRWYSQRLVTQDVGHWFQQKGSGQDFRSPTLWLPSLIIQVLASGAIALGCLIGGASTAAAALTGTTCLGTSLLTGHVSRHHLGTSWEPIRLSLCAFGLAAGLFWTQLPIGIS